MALVPQVVDAVEIPVIAAGGIADSRGFDAALCLGAEGVQLGTVLLATDECPIHENYKNAVIKAKDMDTVVTGRTAAVSYTHLDRELHLTDMYWTTSKRIIFLQVDLHLRKYRSLTENCHMPLI